MGIGAHQLKFLGGGVEQERAKYLILGIPYETGHSFRKGASLGPLEIRKASLNFECIQAAFCDLGDLDVERDPGSIFNSIAEFAGSCLDLGKIPILLGGEHIIAAPASRKFPKLLVLDAHLDLRPEYRGDPYSNACTLARILDQHSPGDLLMIGVRSCSSQELGRARELKLEFLSPEQVPDPKACASWIRAKLGKFYLSLDLDCLDPCFAPSVSNPEPFGLDQRWVRDLIRQLRDCILGMDLAELAPGYDGGQTGLLAAKLIMELMG